MLSIQKNNDYSLTIVPLAKWIESSKQILHVMWNDDWYRKLQQKDVSSLEEYFTNICFSVLDLSDEEQVFVMRTFFISLITDIIHTQNRKKTLQPEVLHEAYQAIHRIEAWENISEFILGISWFVDTITNKLLAYAPLMEDCPHLERALKLIHKHIKDPRLSVQWVAQQVGISTTHLSNLFKLKLDINISCYIAQKKIDEITYELIHTSKSLQEIRMSFGFQSHSHFIQFFKKHKGLTPLKYKEHALQQAEKTEKEYVLHKD